MKPPKDNNRSVWPDAIQEMVLYEVRPHEVTFVDNMDYEKRTNSLTITRADWNAIGNRVAITVGVWQG